MLSSFAAEADDRFVFRRRLLILVIFCVAILNTALLVPSDKFSDSFLETAVEVLAVIVGISMSVVCLMWICGRVLGGDDRGEIYGIRVDAETVSSRAESTTTYDNLSRRQKRRLDRMRSDAIGHLLVGFSMKLRQENLINNSNEETAESDELLEHRIIPITDEEEGNCDASEHNSNTLVMIHQHHDSDDDLNSSTREVPNSCAICLTEYEVSDNVSWSANPQCPHVFHEKCITKWFLSLGRLQTICGVSLEDDCPKNVLNYRQECPCCRQEFISTQD